MVSDIHMRYGRVIRNLRQQKNISQEELADLCGLHRTYISDVELGKRNVSLENIERISNALSVSLTEIFKEVDEYEGV